MAITNGHLDIVQLLVKNGANINTKGYKGSTPLKEAKEYGYKDIEVFLRNNGGTE